MWDADGNLLSDGTRTYSWDAENRLVGISYPGTPGKATSFTYDGFDRRIAITSTPPGGGSPVTTSYLWCGSVICQARDAGNATTREYLAEGEYVPGATPETNYYGVDQIGSVRRIFASASSAPAFSYDPYGVALQTTTPLTDFNYAGMFHSADSGLDLTLYRAYDPAAGRWLSRDPLEEASNAVGKLYAYVEGDPMGAADPLGLQQTLPPPNNIPGGPWRWSRNPENSRGGNYVGIKPGSSASWDPSGHWDVDPGNGERQRYDWRGNPLTKEQAHTPFRGPRYPLIPRTGPLFLFINPCFLMPELCRDPNACLQS